MKNRKQRREDVMLIIEEPITFDISNQARHLVARMHDTGMYGRTLEQTFKILLYDRLRQVKVGEVKL